MRVLLAIDDSKEARQATIWVRDLPLPTDSALCIVMVATLKEPPHDSRSLTALREAVRADAGQVAQSAAALLQERWPRVQSVVVEGDARVEILHVAEESQADIVVVGTRGLGRVKRFLGGSTSLAVARYATCPVAVVQGRARPMERVLVAIDDSGASLAAIEFLSRFEPADGLHAILLHVLPESSDVAQGPEQAKAEQLLMGARSMLAKLRCVVEPMVTAGDAAREIVHVAREGRVDVVVMGARGLRTLGRLFLGSVSETVLHHAGRPVIIVRAP